MYVLRINYSETSTILIYAVKYRNFVVFLMQLFLFNENLTLSPYTFSVTVQVRPICFSGTEVYDFSLIPQQGLRM